MAEGLKKRGRKEDGVEGEDSKERNGMETPAKADSDMGGKTKLRATVATEAGEDWTPILELGTTGHMDFLALTSASLTSTQWFEICGKEKWERRECETKHAEEASLWHIRVEQAHQMIRFPQTANMYAGIKTGAWYSDLCGFSFGPRPLGIAEFSSEVQYTEEDNDRIALSRTITATRCTNCGYLYAMAVTGGKLRAMRHKTMTKGRAKMTRTKKREEVLKKYERVMERIAEENAKSDNYS